MAYGYWDYPYNYEVFMKTGLLIGTLLTGAMLLAGPAHAIKKSDIVLQFSTIGDSRQDPTTAGLNNQDKLFLQNSKAFTRIMNEINHQGSSMLVFNGDMIMGYGDADPTTINNTSLATASGSDFVKYYRQYGFWRGMVATLMENGTYVVPVPGNHETQKKTPTKHATISNENVWRDNMGDLIIDKDRFTSIVGTAPTNFSGDNADPSLAAPGAGDGLTTSQSQLTYSFDVGNSHFVIINTDPVGADAHAPNVWLANDMLAAQVRGAKHYFVFGHKPAYPYIYETGAAPSGMDATSAAAFWNIIESYKATYFCGHEHIYNMSQPAATATPPGSAYQVIVGSGGSPFDAPAADVTNGLTKNPTTDRDYAWATVRVRTNGKVEINTYGFSDTFGPTTALDHVRLAQ